MKSQFGLLKSRLFLPLFLTQFMGAWNDNLMKSTLVVLVAYGSWDTGGIKPEVLVSLAAALFILPFILFTPYAGFLTDRLDKSRIIRYVKLAEIFIVLAAIVTFFTESTLWAFVLLFIMGTQSAFFAPGKLALLPQHLKEERLIGANALISTSTYIAILLATLTATLLAQREGGLAVLSGIMALSALAGYRASLFIPPAPPNAVKRSSGYRWSAYAAFKNTVFDVWRLGPSILWNMLAISWFYFVAGALHSQFPNFAKVSLGVNTNVLSIFFALFSIGIGLGGLLNNSLLKGQISSRFVPFAALAIAMLCTDLYFSARAFSDLSSPDGRSLMNVSDFFAYSFGWRIILDILLLSIAGGVYVIPLRALVQIKAPPDHRARIISANALTDALFLLVSSLMAALLLSIGFEVIDIFWLLALTTALVAVLIFNMQGYFKKD